jgi:hypothetical protein
MDSIMSLTIPIPTNRYINKVYKESLSTFYKIKLIPLFWLMDKQDLEKLTPFSGTTTLKIKHKKV